MNNKLANFWKKIYQDPFKRYLVISLVILGVILLFTSQFTGQEAVKPTTSEDLEVHFFYLPGCSHCNEQKLFNEKLASTYPSIYFISHDCTKPKESALLSKMLADLWVKDEQPSFPVTIFGERAFDGWESAETTGKKIEEALQHWLAGNGYEAGSQEPRDEITLPIIGKIKPSDYSLPGLAVILGLVDGFNPCAMWVLAYFISLITSLKDRRKLWLIVGSFVFASGVLYYLFMAAWLNAFLLIGYFRPLTILIGLVALGAGILYVKEFIETKGAMVCEVVGTESRKKTMSRMDRIVSSPLTLATVAGIIALAFVVNSVEFVCSAALPAIFTHTLSLSSLSSLQYYGYILLYVFFFMLDDFVIFGVAAFAMTSSWGERYAKYCRPLGAVILLILGVLLLFAPHLLR